MRKTFIAAVCLIDCLFVGCAMNKQALLVNLKENESEIQTTGHGFLAIRTEVVANGGSSVGLLLDNEQGEHHYVPLNPPLADSVALSLGPLVVYERLLDKEKHDYKFLLYQLPAGSYRTKYIMVKSGGSNFPKKLQEETINIEASKTKYVGSFQITSDMVWIVTNVFQVEKIEEGPADTPTKLSVPRVGEVPVITDKINLGVAP
jgi:hypothetical protein